jgi:pterin-4a-carbinolamine dehydratase
MSDDKNLLSRISENFQEVTNSGSGEAYTKLSGALEKMDSELREYAQKLAIDDMKAVLQKLKNDEKLSDEDLKNLKTWIVGDAEYFISKEHDFDNWTAALERSIKEIKDLWSEHPDADRLLKLRSLARDAIGVVANISFFVTQKESVEKFNAATKEIGETERMVLMSLLEQRVSSSRF